MLATRETLIAEGFITPSGEPTSFFAAKHGCLRKGTYASIAAAMPEARRVAKLEQKRVIIYVCDFCRGLHIGKRPTRYNVAKTPVPDKKLQQASRIKCLQHDLQDAVTSRDMWKNEAKSWRHGFRLFRKLNAVLEKLKIPIAIVRKKA